MRRILSIIILFVCAISLYAVPANRKPIVVKQSDGTVLRVVLNGDEALHFYTTLDGKFVVKDDNGDFCYAIFSQENRFVSTGVVAHNKAERSDEEMQFLSTIDYEEFGKAVLKTHKARSAKYRGAVETRATSSSITTKGEVLVPVLLVEYKDKKFTYTKEDIEKLLNEEGYKYNFMDRATSNGSARDYFIAQSGGQFTPKFVVTDIVTLPNNMSYYGANDYEGNDKKPHEMIVKGLELADNAGMDFSQFDNNKDGHVEFVYCIYAGYSEANGAEANTVWPHQWDLVSAAGSKKEVDGVYCDVYACSSELNITEEYEDLYGKWLAGIGTICHEFSHCLGLPDVYDVYYESTNWCMDEWDIMDQGNYVAYGYIPVGYNSYQKDLCGWQSLVVLDKKGEYSMKPQSQGGVGYKIVNDANPNEYFILENRRREGWDQMLAADGMMIIHVDYNKNAWEDNEVNIVSGHPRFQLVPADNELYFYPENEDDVEEFYNSLAGDLWPGKNNNNEFTDTSVPAAKLFTGEKLNKPVTNIKYENYVASFKFMSGFVEAPIAMPATGVTLTSFIANWSVVEGVTGYVAELYRLEDTVGGDGEAKTLIKEDFLKCSKANAEISASQIDDYMSVSGWDCTNIYSENGLLRIGSSKNVGELVTPLLNAIGNITVSLKVNKYNSNDKSFEFVVKVLDASGKEIAVKNVTSAGNVSLEANVDGAFYVCLCTGKGGEKKRVLIDDILITAMMSYKKTLVESVCTDVTAHEFTDLEQGKYVYRVKAVEDDEESAFSEFVDVVLGTSSVIDSVAADESVVVYTISGVKVYEGNLGEVHDLPSGMYVVKSASGVKKIKFE